jgi:RNA polymerase-binding transcription factor DksA
MYLRKNYLSIRTDIREFDNPSDMFGHCRKCGRQLVVLPDDQRFGYCFDCLDHLQISRKAEVVNGRSFSVPHENGYCLQ